MIRLLIHFTHHFYGVNKSQISHHRAKYIALMDPVEIELKTAPFYMDVMILRDLTDVEMVYVVEV